MKIKIAIVITLLMPLLSSGLLAADLLILAPDEFVDELLVLQKFKNASARTTDLIGLSTITTNPAYAANRDDPERIKRYIAEYKTQNGLTSVLLVGDCDKFPVRYIRAQNTEWGIKYYPSDLYYADIYDDSGVFDNWDGNGDNILGDTDFSGGTDINLVNLDGIDMHPDIEVARVPASTEAEVTTYVNKVIGYELNAPGTWYDDAYLFVGDWGGDGKMDGVAPYLSDFASVNKRYMSQPPYDSMTDAQRIAIVNTTFANGTGLMLYHGHGNRDNWDNWYNVASMGGLINTNDELPVMFATACYTGRFHFAREYYRDTSGSIWNRLGQAGPFIRPEPDPIQPSACDNYENESMAEHLTVKRDTGAIGYIGCTSVAEHGVWISASEGLCLSFCKKYDEGKRRFGQLWRESMDDFVDYVAANGMHYYAYIHIHKMFCFGDPSVIMGGAYTNTIQGEASDIWMMGYRLPCFFYNQRYRLTGNVYAKAGELLTAGSGASILFGPGMNLSVPETSEGFVAVGANDRPVHLLASISKPYATNKIRGLKVTGVLSLKNGGGIKMY